MFVPPSGHMAGLYARNDNVFGVHNAPANITLNAVVGLETLVSKQAQDVLHPKGINVIRAFPGRGIRPWGARTMSSEALWNQVNVRRLFIYIEDSVDSSLQYAPFKPNDRPLWNRLKASLTDFLTGVWRDGGLQGLTQAEAFFVKVGLGETMVPADINAYRVIVVVGIAPVKPAEYVIIRIGQKPDGAVGVV